jgi:hypothetical protein
MAGIKISLYTLTALKPFKASKLGVINQQLSADFL